jgi:hypothetical protein
MAKRIKTRMPDRMISILLWFCFIILTPSIIASNQPQQFTQEEFKQELIKAVNQNNEKLADSLISNHRLMVKPFVDGLIKEVISKELKGNLTESRQLSAVC